MGHAMDTSGKFGEMTAAQKGVFLVKFVLFVASFGFAFPLLLSEN